MREWRIYYDDGVMVSGSTQHAWDAAPTDGVLFLAHRREDGRWEVNSSNDYYFLYQDALGYTNDLSPLLRKLRLIKFGRWASPEVMNEIAARISEELNVTMNRF